MTEWISVKDKLPEFDIPVLVFSRREDVVVCRREQFGRDRFRWCVIKLFFDWDWGFLGDKEVTHWMPIPEKPPRKGDVTNEGN